MPRSLTAGMQTAVAAANSTIVHLVELQFSGGTIRFAMTAANISWNSQTWTAVGGNLSFDAVQETADERGQGVAFTFSGVDLALIAVILGENHRGRRMSLWRAHVDNSGAIIADPVKLFDGLMNEGFEIEETSSREPGTCTIKTRFVSRLAIFKQSRGFRTQLESHQAVHPGDTFFQHVAAVSGRKIYWGIPTPSGASNT